MPDRARVRGVESPATAAAELLRRVRHPVAGKQRQKYRRQVREDDNDDGDSDSDGDAVAGDIM